VNKKTYNTHWLSFSRKIDQHDWAYRISQLNDKIRGPVARMIWWDFFAGRMVSERWSALDEFVPAPRNLTEDWTNDELRDGLMACGYPEMEAARRSSDKKAAYALK
jgi:hypothetical protein